MEITKGKTALLLFDDTKSKAKLFMPNSNETIVMEKTTEGNWNNGNYKLIDWKGYVIQYKGMPIFGGK